MALIVACYSEGGVHTGCVVRCVAVQFRRSFSLQRNAQWLVEQGRNA